MPGDMSIYSVALEWLRVPSHVLPAVVAILFMAGVVFLRSSRLEIVKTKQDAVSEATRRVDDIEDYLDDAMRELASAYPNESWEPHEPGRGTVVAPKGIIYPETDERCRRIVDDLNRICDAHLPEFRPRVLSIEERIREFAQHRRDVLSSRDAVFRLESELASLSSKELEAIAENRVEEGWGETFVDPMKKPMEQRARAAAEARLLIEIAEQEHLGIRALVDELRTDLQGAAE